MELAFKLKRIFISTVTSIVLSLLPLIVFPNLSGYPLMVPVLFTSAIVLANRDLIIVDGNFKAFLIALSQNYILFFVWIIFSLVLRQTMVSDLALIITSLIYGIVILLIFNQILEMKSMKLGIAILMAASFVLPKCIAIIRDLKTQFVFLEDPNAFLIAYQIVFAIAVSSNLSTSIDKREITLDEKSN